MTPNSKHFFEWLANDLIADALDTIDADHTYVIQAQVGDYKFQPKQGKIHKKNKPIITGTLISRQNDLVPIKGYELVTTTSSLSLIVPVPMVDDVLDAVSKFVVENNGDITKYEAIQDNETTENINEQVLYDVQLLLETPIVTNTDQRQGAGTSSEIRLFITTVVSREAVYGNDIKLTVDGEQLLVLQAALQTVKTYQSDNAGNAEYAVMVPDSQSVTITAKVAYRKTAKLMEIVGNMLRGTLRQEYAVEFEDGAAFSSTANPSTVFSMYMTVGQATLSFAAGEIAAVDLVLYRKEQLIPQEEQR